MKCTIKYTMKNRIILLLVLFLLPMNVITLKAGEEGAFPLTLRHCIPELVRTIDPAVQKVERLNVQVSDGDYLEYAKTCGYLQGIKEKNMDDFLSSYDVARLTCNILRISPAYSTYEGLLNFQEPNGEYIVALGLLSLWDPAIGEKMTWEQWRALLNRLEMYTNRREEYYKREDIKNFQPFVQGLQEKEQKKNIFHLLPSGTVVGQVEATLRTTKINQYEIPTYLYKGRRWVNIHHLSNFGFDLRWNAGEKVMHMDRNRTKEIRGLDLSGGVEELKGNQVLYTDTEVYIGIRRVPSYQIKGWTFIPLEELYLFGMVQQEGEQIHITVSDFAYESGFVFEMGREKWCNKNQEKVDIKLTHIWYHVEKKQYRQIQEERCGLEANFWEPISMKRFVLDDQEIYIGTVIDSVGDRSNPYLEMDKEYMYTKERLQYFMDLYQYKINQEILDMVKPSIIIGTMKRNAGIFQQGEKVEILYGEDGKWYECKSVSTGKQGRIPWGSVTIPPDPITNPHRMTQEQLEWYVSQKGFTSSTPYLIWTDLDRQVTYVFEKKEGKWVLIRTMLCSTGKNITPTPRGFFQIQDRGSHFGKGYMAKNWVRIKGDYLFHSVLFDEKGQYLLERGVLGRRASQGCIRFSFEDSQWFYQRIPKGSTVWIN